MESYVRTCLFMTVSDTTRCMTTNKYYIGRHNRSTIDKHSPISGVDTESNFEWLQNFNTHIFRPSVFFKGPLLSILPQIMEQLTAPCFLNYQIYKTNIKRKLLEIQSNGNEEDWLAENFILYNIPGLSKTSHKRIRTIVSYLE